VSDAESSPGLLRSRRRRGRQARAIIRVMP
jgi:hypothetical protein